MVPLNSSGKESGQMATGDVAVGAPGAGSSAALQTPTSKRIVNDFSIQVATVNGSGSQSANLVLLKSIFGMGIPVSGKNLFPSNIAGLPTWYTIRASKQGYVARKREIELLVAMNAETASEDILSLPTGAAAIYDEGLNLKQYRDDVICYPVPFDKLTAAVCPEAKLRKLVRNMIYVGVVAQLLAMDLTAVENAVRRQFAKKQKAADLNWSAVKAGYDFAATFLDQAGPAACSSPCMRPRAKSSSMETPRRHWARCSPASPWSPGIPSRPLLRWSKVSSTT